MKNKRLISFYFVLLLILLPMPIMATGPRVTKSMLETPENEIFAVDEQPFLGLGSSPHRGLSAEILQSAFQAVNINVSLTLLPVAKMVDYYLYEENALAVFIQYQSIKTTQNDHLLLIPLLYDRYQYFYSKRQKPDGLIWNDSLNELKGLVYGSTPGEDTSKFNQAGLSVVKLKPRQLLKKLLAGEVDFLRMSELRMKWLLQTRIPQSHEDILAINNQGELIPKYVAFNIQHPNAERLAQKLKQGLLLIIENGQYATILKKYLNDDSEIQHRMEAVLTTIKH